MKNTKQKSQQRKRGKGVSIKTKLIGAFALILIIPTFLVSIIGYTTSRNEIENDMANASKENVTLINETINHFIYSNVENIDFLSANIGEVLQDSPEGKVVSPTVREKLSDFQKNHTLLSSTYIGTVNGDMILEPNEELPADYDPRERPWYKLAIEKKGEVVITEPYVDAVKNTSLITIAKTLENGQGVVAIDLNMKALEESISKVKIGDEGYVMLLDAKEKYIVHPEHKTGEAVTEKWAKEVYSKESGSLEYELDGNDKKMFFLTNDITGWKISGTMYEEEIKNAASTILNRTAIVLMVSLIVGSFFVYFIIRSIVRPLNKLMLVSRKVSEGDLTETVEVKSTDELGQLSDSFNSMINSLKSVLASVSEQAVRLSASSEELVASSSESAEANQNIASTLQDLLKGSEQQSQSVNGATTIIQEISNGIQHIASTSEEVSQEAINASKEATSGQEVISSLVVQMKSINENIGQLSQKINDLGQRSKQIGTVADAITKIAGQTKLLSFNANIEAAHAGEAGAGFGVVATEIGKLAEQSAHSGQQISDFLDGIQDEIRTVVDTMDKSETEVSKGITLVSDTGQSFNSILKSVENVAAQIQEVSAAMEEISSSTGDIVSSMDKISEVGEETVAGTQTVSAATEQQLASSEEVKLSASELAKMAEELQLLIGIFKF